MEDKVYVLLENVELCCFLLSAKPNERQDEDSLSGECRQVADVLERNACSP